MDTGRKTKAPAGRRRWYTPPRTLNTLMSAVAVSGLAFAAVAPRPGASPPAWPPGMPPPWVVQYPGPTRLLTPYDPFLVAPREGLDPGFVVAAPRGIDDSMIAPPGRQFVAPARPQTWPIPIPPTGR